MTASKELDCLAATTLSIIEILMIPLKWVVNLKLQYLQYRDSQYFDLYILTFVLTLN